MARPASSSRAAREMLMSGLHWELSLWVTRWMLRISRPAAVSVWRARDMTPPDDDTIPRHATSREGELGLVTTGPGRARPISISYTHKAIGMTTVLYEQSL